MTSGGQRSRLPFLAVPLGGIIFCACVVLDVLVGRTFGTADGTWVTLWLCPPLVGAVTAALRPRNLVGWLLLAIGAIGVTSQFAYSYAPGPRISDTQALLIAAGDPLLYLAMLLVAWLILVFPSGHFTPGWRLRLVATGGIVYVLGLLPSFLLPTLSSDARPYANPLQIRALNGAVNSANHGFTVFAVVAVALVGADAIWRLRRAVGVQRQQFKWLALASVLMVPSVILAITAPSTWWWTAFPLVIATNGTAASIGLAIVRYRLYDIDRLISRTVAYLIVVGLLSGVYVGCVLLLTTVLPLRGSVSVVVAVLVAVGLFAPVRARARDLVDRRFNRSRYNAQAVVADFAARLGEQVTLDAISSDLVAAVEKTVQPSHTSLWLRGH
ncbi:MAG: hypothetical protein ACRENX_10615 [Candidatus Dormibacteria bacterium]